MVRKTHKDGWTEREDKMTTEQFDAFTDDATHKLRDMWGAIDGNRLDVDAMDELNDLLTSFFGQQRDK